MSNLAPGDPIPSFHQLCEGRQFYPESMAGRYLLFCLLDPADSEAGRFAHHCVMAKRDRFDDQRVSAFLISTNPSDQVQGRLHDMVPGIRIMWDLDLSVSRLFSGLPEDAAEIDAAPRPSWVLVDPSLHVLAVFALAETEALFDRIDALPHPSRFAGFEIPAPVLVLPNVLDQSLCRHLIGLYDQHGGDESGFMRADVDVLDHSFKSRKDYTIEDGRLIQLLQGLIARRVLPEIEKLFFMKITRMERYMVGCYSAEDGGHFMPHRDNNSGLTSHRRFAISINLNSDFEGGEVSFPEYNPRAIKAPPGWCVVFPAAILHAVSKVTRGRRMPSSRSCTTKVAPPSVKLT